MSDALTTYLQDHLAGAKFAVSLLEDLRTNGPEDVKGFAGDLLVEVEEDRQILIRLAERISDGSHPLKDATAWLAQKASRVKLSAENRLGVFEGLELLCIGIEGKRALWTALRTICHGDPRLADVDFESLVQRAIDQHRRVDQTRLEAARMALQFHAE